MTAPLTDAEIEKMEKALENTTQGRWGYRFPDCRLVVMDKAGKWWRSKLEMSLRNCDFIVDTHNDYFPRLLAETKRLREENEDLRIRWGGEKVENVRLKKEVSCYEGACREYREEVTRLRADLDKYRKHLGSCRSCRRALADLPEGEEK